jgi:GNAT superfamily N-acetyltransferase
MNTIENIPTVKISRYTPSQIIELSKARPDIADHIIAGYGIPDAHLKSREEIIEEEYSHGENRTIIFLAEVDGQIVGSLYFILWHNSIDDKRGGKFMQYIAENGEGIIDLEALSKYVVLACDVGIVVHPDFQGKGIVNRLYKAGVNTINPAFIVGQTKTPGAVIARSRILEEYGYSTAYGGLSVIDNLLPKLTTLITEAYYFSRQDVLDRIPGKSVHYAQTEALQPEINVNISKLSDNVRQVFENIIYADTDKPEGSVTFAPLVSITKDLILD